MLITTQIQFALMSVFSKGIDVSFCNVSLKATIAYNKVIAEMATIRSIVKPKKVAKTSKNTNPTTAVEHPRKKSRKSSFFKVLMFLISYSIVVCVDREHIQVTL